MGFELGEAEAQAMLPRVRNFVAAHKHPPEVSDLRDLLASARSHLHV
jgi:homocitrate synthase NifV